MQLFFIVLVLTFFACNEAHTFDYVRKYLADHQESYEPTLGRNDPFWLKNSNTIGLGYNPVYGSPACYTGQCQGDGFRRSVFKLNYTQPASGSCSSRLIPNFVELHCIPSADLQSSTEIISTMNQLSESTSKGISFGADVKYKMFSAGYSQSRETRFMTDQMTKQDTTATFTRGQVTWGKLSMFEPMMELSDTFRYVIEEMPCCDNSNVETDEYIEEFLIDYFGLTFVTELILGGIAQETLFVENQKIREMQSKGEAVSHSASVGFILSFNVKTTSAQEKAQHNELMKSVKNTRSTKLGGDPSAQTMNAWIKSVPDNPVIMSHTVKGSSDIIFGATYQLLNVISNKALDIEGAKTQDATNVQIYSDHGGIGQRWIIRKNRDGTVTLVNPNSGKALDVSRCGTSTGGIVQIYSDDGINEQKWRVKSVGDEVYTFINVCHGLALDVTNSGTKDETNVQAAQENGTAAQKWRLVRLS
ncbi:unnamed protein product [Adineta steineri]|uniref:MACPF domain-containing protein n=1 Tax=Adineta steineri TaxID=433720 RepID=A0A814LDN2_9BILA|nr:unnamed protein product [Adineta steineri]CAF1061956.1 unnamed protein product [Adineta steineri]